MSFPGGRKRPFYPSYPFLLLIIISLLHIWASSSSQSKAVAIRIFPRLLVALDQQEEQQYPQDDSMEPPPPAGNYRNQTEIFKEYFNARLADLNSSTTATANSTILDSKRRIPSCPDPLHN